MNKFKFYEILFICMKELLDLKMGSQCLIIPYGPYFNVITEITLKNSLFVCYTDNINLPTHNRCLYKKIKCVSY